MKQAPVLAVIVYVNLMTWFL